MAQFPIFINLHKKGVSGNVPAKLIYLLCYRNPPGFQIFCPLNRRLFGPPQKKTQKPPKTWLEFHGPHQHLPTSKASPRCRCPVSSGGAMVLKLSVAAGGGSSGQSGKFGWDVLATKLGIGEKNLQNTSEVTMAR